MRTFYWVGGVLCLASLVLAAYLDLHPSFTKEAWPLGAAACVFISGYIIILLLTVPIDEGLQGGAIVRTMSALPVLGEIRSPCCKVEIGGALGDGVLVGLCCQCWKPVCRKNPRTGRNEWLNGESPWTSHDDLPHMPV